MLRAVIFDFDGVIADSEVLHFRAFNKVLAGHGFQITKEQYFSKYLGLTDLECFRSVAKERLVELDEGAIEKLLEEKRVVFEQMAKTEVKIIDGVPELLRVLRSNGIPAGICSGALLEEIEMILKGAGLREFFEVIVAAGDIEKCKPDPEGFLLALERLNSSRGQSMTPGDCVVIEDSHWGIEAARAAGMHIVAVTNSYGREQLAGAELIVEDLGKLSIEQLEHLCA